MTERAAHGNVPALCCAHREFLSGALEGGQPVEAAPPSSALAPSRPEGLIEIVLAGGMVVRMDAHVDGRALRRVLGALEGR